MISKPFAPTDVNTAIIALERRMNVAEMRERGTGRGGWMDVVSTMGRAVKDGAVPSWRLLNDGRIELRGRLTIAAGAPVTNGATVLQIHGDCAPPGPSSVAAWAPCSSSGSNPGVVRVDFVQRPVAPTADYPYDKVTAVLAYPPQNLAGGLTDWIGFDHVDYDPHLYLDVLPPVTFGQAPLVDSRAIAVINQGGQTFSVIPGVEPTAKRNVIRQPREGGAE